LGIDSASKVADLAGGGASAALIAFTIVGPGTTDEPPYYYPPLQAVTLLAGTLPEGDVTSLRMPEYGTQGLPPGRYAAFIGDDSRQGNYFLTLGYSGLMTLSAGGVATQTCGPGTGSQALQVAPGSPVAEHTLISWSKPVLLRVQKELARAH
jgi:hypothetical protein